MTATSAIFRIIVLHCTAFTNHNTFLLVLGVVSLKHKSIIGIPFSEIVSINLVILNDYVMIADKSI